MRFLSFGQSPVAGLDIGSHSIKVVELRRGRRSWRLCHAAYLRRPSDIDGGLDAMSTSSADENQTATATKPMTLVEAIREAVVLSGTNCRRVVCSLPGSDAVIRYFRFPSLSPKELTSAIRLEAEQVIPFDIDDVDLDYQVLPGTSSIDENASTGIFVAARRSMVAERIRATQEAGLEMAAIDSDTLSLVNCFLGAGPDLNDEAVAVLNIGAIDANLGIVREGGHHFCRDISLAGSVLERVLSRLKGIQPEQANNLRQSMMTGCSDCDLREIMDYEEVLRGVLVPLIGELRKSMKYYKTQQSVNVSQIYICGGCSGVPRLGAVIAEGVGIPAQWWNPLHHVDVDLSTSHQINIESQGPSMAVAMGLAMREDV